jgi:hypothetical protein
VLGRNAQPLLLDLFTKLPWRKMKVGILGSSSSNKHMFLHLDEISLPLLLLVGRDGEGDEEGYGR